MNWPPADHPAWKILQSLIGLAALIILVAHGVDGGHQGGVDLEDGIGLLGGGLGLNLGRQLLMGKRNSS